jgi:hypothetical protein
LKTIALTRVSLNWIGKCAIMVYLDPAQMHSIKKYRQGIPTYDNSGCTVSLIITHARHKWCRLRAIGINNRCQRFSKGVMAYRNVCEWAKEKRDRFINQADARISQT